MSANEQIYFDPGRMRERDAAEAIAAAVRGTLVDNSSGLGAFFALDDIEAGAFVTGSIWENEVPSDIDPDDPEDNDVFDTYPLVWTMTSGPRRDDELSRRGARIAFQRLVDAQLGWTMVLTHNSGELIAIFDPARGLREFPPGTRTDGVDRHIWD